MVRSFDSQEVKHGDVGWKTGLGRACLSALAGLALLLSGVMKLKGGPELEQGFSHLGLPMSIRVPLAILEISCAVIYSSR